MNDHLELELKIGEPSDDGTIEGFASIFGETDLVGDQVQHGAFTKSLAKARRSGRLPLMLWSHQLDQPIGKWTSITETAEGLMVKGKLLLDVARAREVYAMLREKVVDGLSIGFRTVRSQRIKTGRLLQELDLAEISLVTLPALSSARVTSVKSGGRRVSKDHAMPLDLSVPDDDGAVEQMAAALPPEFVERIKAVETKAGAVDEIAGRLDRIETRLARPSARIEVKDDPQAEMKAFGTLCRKGWADLPDLERKILTAGGIGSPASDGWQLVPEVFIAEMQRNLVEASPMRQVARVMQVSGSPVKLPKRLTNLVASWVGETEQHGLSDPTYGQQELHVYEARVSTEVTNQLIEDSAFNIASELAIDFGEAFGLLEGTAFISGSGVGEPEGILTSNDFVVTLGGTVDADALIALYYSIPDRYASRGTWLMRRSTQAAVRQLRADPAGPYLWIDGLAPNQPATLLGRPVVEFPDLPGSGQSPVQVSVIFGDISKAYRIVDRVGLQILRDPYSAARRSVVTFHARRRTGGALVDGAAVVGLAG